MKKSIRFCALLLTLCMVLALGPANVFATTKISAVTITGLDAPTLYGTPDCDATVSVTPGNCYVACFVDWYVYSTITGKPGKVSKNYEFCPGDVAYAVVQLLTEEGYCFGDFEEEYTGTVNMKDRDVDQPAWVASPTHLILYTKDYYIVADTVGEQISAVSVSDLDMPIAGESPDYDITITTQPADILSEVQVLWARYDEETNTAVLLDASHHVFAEGERVLALAYVVPQEGYIFGEPLKPYEGKVTLPYEGGEVMTEIDAYGYLYILLGEWTVSKAVVGTFVDVIENYWYTDAVAWAVNNGITTGVDKYHFAPDEGCTRAQAVTFLWRAAGKPEPTVTECAFVDVDVTQYYYKAVLWAVENGITNGTDATHFEPHTVCTRAHIVTFLYRALKGTVSETATNPFVDVPAGEWYTDAVLWAAENGVTTGTDAEHFEPEGTCIRSHIVTFIYRAMAK